MVPQLAEPALSPTITASARVVQAMARREGARLDWTSNTLVEQGVPQNTNKAQQTGRQIHPPLWDKEGNSEQHTLWMVHFIFKDHSTNWKVTEVQLTQKFNAHTPLIHHPYLSCTRHLRRGTKVYVPTTPRCRGQGLQGIHLGTVQRPTRHAWHEIPTWPQPSTGYAYQD